MSLSPPFGGSSGSARQSRIPSHASPGLPHPLDRTPGLLWRAPLAYNASDAPAGLLRRAPIELDERVSTHPALRVSALAGGWSAPLGRLVRPALPGGAAHLDDRQSLVCVHDDHG